MIWKTTVIFTGKLTFKSGKNTISCCVLIIDHTCWSDAPRKKLSRILLEIAKEALFSVFYAASIRTS